MAIVREIENARKGDPIAPARARSRPRAFMKYLGLEVTDGCR